VQLGFFVSQLATVSLVMKDSQEGQLERTHLCTKGKQCVFRRWHSA